MVSWGEVKQWRPDPFHEAVGALNDQYTKLTATSDELAGAATPDGWSGPAAGAAANKVNSLVDQAEEWSAEIAGVRRATGDVGDAITGLQHGIEEAEGLAKAQHFTIGEDGAVTDNGPPSDVPPEQAEAVAGERQKTAEELRERVRAVLREATDIDQDFCAVLDKVLSGHIIDAQAGNNDNTNLAAAGNAGAAQSSLSILAPPAGDATPTQNAAWFASLSENQKFKLANDRPELIGSRDGVSAKYRDIGNRKLLDTQKSQLEGEARKLQQELDDNTFGGTFTDADDRLEEIKGKLDGINDIDQTLASTADAPEGKRHYLLGLDSESNGKAIIAKGNPDTAKNVASYVPGMGSNLAGISGEQSKSEAMWKAAGGDRTNTSVITWQGYDAPPGLSDAMSSSYADDGKRDFTEFQQGLRASHEGAPSHNVAVGHSYGTTLVGHAARDGNVPVDDVVFAGSPGVGVDHANELNVPPGHVYSTEAKNDIIRMANQEITTSPGQLEGVDPVHGPDPTGEDFGAHTFAAAPGTEGSLGGVSNDAHSEYWDRGNSSLTNMGLIINGHPPQ